MCSPSLAPLLFAAIVLPWLLLTAALIALMVTRARHRAPALSQPTVTPRRSPQPGYSYIDTVTQAHSLAAGAAHQPNPQSQETYPMPVKPGYKTTEFYAMIASLLISLLIALQVLEPGEETVHLEETIVDTFTAAAALITNAALIARYIDARTDLKLPAEPPAPLEELHLNV